MEGAWSGQTGQGSGLTGQAGWPLAALVVGANAWPVTLPLSYEFAMMVHSEPYSIVFILDRGSIRVENLTSNSPVMSVTGVCGPIFRGHCLFSEKLK